MWFPTVTPDDRWDAAIEHLSRDRTMARIIERVGPCMLRPTPDRDHYVRLVQSILSQQVSVKAARALYAKLAAQFPRKRPTPKAMVTFLTTSPEELIRSCGLSRQKRSYVLDLATRFADGSILPRRFAAMSDDELVEHLTVVKGIGRWTVEMLMIFALNRPDVWPVDDLAIRESVYRHWPRQFKERPTARELRSWADKWRPWRTVASWYLWRGLQPDTK
jgi:DNA-3-methyladenine glycosylase II